MKLIAFRIKNFRSVRDSGWHDLAYDNITCLIGQNESGKTSLLEGLKAFYDAYLIEDMLRSDLSIPEVSCRFKFDFSQIEKQMDTSSIHPDVVEKLNSLESISLKRVWESDMSSYVVTGEELEDIFKVEEEVRKNREVKVLKMLQSISDELKKADLSVRKVYEELKGVEESLESKKQEITEKKKSNRSFFSKDRSSLSKEELKNINDSILALEEDRKKKEKNLKEKEENQKQLQQKQVLLERITNAEKETHARKSELRDARDSFLQLSSLIGLEPSEKELRAAEAKEEQLRLEIELAKDALEESQRDYDQLMLAAEKVANGEVFEKAFRISGEELDKLNKFMGAKALGEAFFKFTPEYEMFEDFSSLLPNRIDLDDIVAKNSNAEGYKAAINFLTITGLDYSFFQQPSSRILKQKIENLNGELTLNFQDFWRQNVGKNNKIKINFELAHYDRTHEEKSGKPFIEFWIKDEAERLYPKQRSRGVRWFLSFFLELKATAMDKSRQNKVLLIDEPGVSLHARAQEDVLKVFDDIKENMQIIYTTHSPHLIDVNKLYRVIAVQRAVEDDMTSETLVLNARSLKTATADTLSPVYAMMGTRLSQQDIVKANNNVIVKDLATFYFLKAVLKLSNYDKKECFFIPASGTSSMPMIINILIGWGLEYIALNFGNDEEKFMYNKLRKELFENNVDLANMQLLYISEFADVEDMFSTIDFKKYVVHVREGITINNSEYLKDNNHSRAVLASNFLQDVQREKITLKDFDEETRDNFKMLMDKLSLLLK